MKKIVTLAAIAAMSMGMVFADPVANLNIAEFSGNAKVEWGVDLDAGKTGFLNAEYLHFTVNLFDGGDKSTSSDDDIWAELVLKAGNTGNWSHKLAEYDTETSYTADNVNNPFAGEYSINVDTAKFHIFNFYVGILNGDTQTGEYKFDGAIRGYDHWRNQAKWLTNVGPDNYSQGIVAGYADNNLDVAVDLRSYYDKDKSNTQYTSAYALAAEAKLNDSNEWLEGLSVDIGGSLNLNDESYSMDSNNKAVLNRFGISDPTGLLGESGGSGYDDAKEAYDKALKTYKNAAEALAKGELEYKDAYDNTKNLSEGSDDIVSVAQAVAAAKTALDAIQAPTTPTIVDAHSYGYSANLGYKLKLDDKYWFKPSVAFTGALNTGVIEGATKTKLSSNSNNLVFGAMFGWGSPADSDTGLYYLDGDDGNNSARKITPGVSVVATIPLATTSKAEGDNYTANVKSYDKVAALIVPSFWTNGELVEGLKAGLYSEMAILNSVKAADQEKRTFSGNTIDVVNRDSAKSTETFAFALAGAVAYDIKADAITVTPQVGFRYANGAYFDNEINGIAPLSNAPMFQYGLNKMGVQSKKNKKKNADGGDTTGYGDFLNLKAGVNVNGLINNTDFYLVYASANLLNSIVYPTETVTNQDANTTYADVNTSGWYNVKAGTLTVGAKISL